MSSFKQNFTSKLYSGSQVIWVYLSGDAGRAERQLEQIARHLTDTTDMNMQWHTWDCIGGASWDDTIKDPTKALLSVNNTLRGSGLVLMRDFGNYLNGPAVKNMELRRALANLCVANALNSPESTKAVIVLATTPAPHADIAEYCDVIDFALPAYAEMREDVVDFIVESISKTPTDVAEGETAPEFEAPADELLEKISRSLLGTTAEEAQRIFAYAVSVSGGISEDVLEVIADEKAKVIRKVDGLKFIPHSQIPGSESIGGFKKFLPWMKKRARAYSKHAQEVGLELPRGSALIGPPGTGKTVVAKAAAKMLGLDLVILDVGSMFSKYVGDSEAKIRAALQVVESMPNVLLMVDEIEVFSPPAR